MKEFSSFLNYNAFDSITLHTKQMTLQGLHFRERTKE